MNNFPSDGPGGVLTRPGRFHQWRIRKDRAARWLIALGGTTVLFFIVLIFFYLLWVVLPLFFAARVDLQASFVTSGPAARDTVLLAMDERRTLGMRLLPDGRALFFSLGDGEPAGAGRIPLREDESIVVAARAAELDGAVAVATDKGRVYLFRHAYEARFTGGVETREILPRIEFPFGEEPVIESGAGAPSLLALSIGRDGFVVAAANPEGRIWLNRAEARESFLTGERELVSDRQTLDRPIEPTGLAIGSARSWLYAGDRFGNLHALDLRSGRWVEPLALFPSAVTGLATLAGGESLVAGSRNGELVQVFPVREGGQVAPRPIRRFEPLEEPVQALLPESHRRGFAVLGEQGALGLYHATSGRRLLVRERMASDSLAAALSPRADHLLLLREDGLMDLFDVENRHPEVSFATLWQEVWYEKYPGPAFVWQSSAASDRFEAKYSLVPLVFGTIKAAVYAMVVAIPLALMSAVYTAFFMSPRLRNWLKPGIEMMAAMPTVILGFLAGLWFAPYLEKNLAGFLLLIPVLLAGLVLLSLLRLLLPQRWSAARFRGKEPLLLIPAVVGLVLLAFALDDPIQAAFFGGSLSHWLEASAGIPFDQRNSLVVGVAMGFAVVPIIFSLAEDALHDVPDALARGSLALGATPWQTLVRVVLPVASPGIFSALMIGFGRAVGETMIILMVTGNTPIMDWNLFEGMRTLAANITIEAPESELNSSHYRILFLSALVLFIFTFLVNTAAAIIRQRLRSRYSAL